MAWTSYQVFLAILLVTTGSLNTLTTKWADKIDSKSSDGIIRPFNHPFTQALVMFLGEMMCLATFKIVYAIFVRRDDGSQDSHALVQGSRTFPVSVFFVPAMCDMIATSLMYVGLTLTYPASFQMLRGSLIVFVALLSVGFLGKSINSREWFGIFMIMGGLAIVGAADVMSLKGTNVNINGIVTGDLLIIMAQTITAIQMVYEEHFVSRHNVPSLQAVGWEGVFGFSVLALLHIPMYFIYVGKFAENPRHVIEDLPDAFVQIGNNPLLLVPILGTLFSIAFFNFAGISVTKEVSAATRTVLDSVRTLFIWLVSILVGWQDFVPIQILGFFLLVMGMMIYNDIFVTSAIRRIAEVYSRRPSSPQREILINQPADETA